MRIYIVQRLHKEVNVGIMGSELGVRLCSDRAGGAVGILWAFRSEDAAKAFAEGAPVIAAEYVLDDDEAD
jgi:hypothetical protein